MSEKTNKTEEEKEMSPQQIKELKDTQHKYYKEQIPFLKTTLEYEKLIADIEEARLKYYSMRMRIAQMLAPPLEQEFEENEPQEREPVSDEPPAPKRERKLKSQA